MKVRGKNFVVTGAGSGMGRQMSLELVRRGATVAAIDIHDLTLQETKKLAGAQSQSISTFVVDITDGAAVAALPARITAEMGVVDGLINNAGIIQPFVPIAQLDGDAAAKVMNVNFWGAYSLIKTFLPELMQRPQAHILNVSSMGAYAPVPGQSLYGASKAALKLLTEGLRSELKGTQVGVTIAFPGAVDTNISANSGIAVPSGESAKFKSMPAEKAATIMINAIEKNKARVIVGRDARTMDLLSRLNPVWAANLIYKQMKSLLKQ